MTMTSIVLAGGRSSRFGWSKALDTIGGKSLIQLVVDRLTLLSREIIIVTAQRDRCTSPSLGPGLGRTVTIYPHSSRLKMIADVYPGKGPLGGIYTGLVTASCLQAIVVGCDMPFLNVALLDYMSQISSGFDVVVPRIRGRVEPLCAVYSRNCLVPIHRLLERNELRISKLFDVVKVKHVAEEDINRFDPEHLSFFNINTQADLNEAKRLAIKKG